MKFRFYFLSLTMIFSGLATASEADSSTQAVEDISAPSLQLLAERRWNHGAIDCSASDESAIEIFQYSASSYILRQSKCLSYEAPFIYLLIGEESALLVDTGATESAEKFPLYSTVISILESQSTGGKRKPITVVHSHSHSDHRAGDSQFSGSDQVTLVEPSAQGLSQFFDFSGADKGEVKLDLGARTITVFPIPGHQQESIAIYDSRTQWLLTGDTFYPGYVYVKNWDAYRQSIARLVDFSQHHSVSALLGTHIEMKTEPEKYYPIGTLYQPDEASLVLSVGDLTRLNQALVAAEKPQELVFDKFVVAPLSGLQKAISGIVGWFVD